MRTVSFGKVKIKTDLAGPPPKKRTPCSNKYRQREGWRRERDERETEGKREKKKERGRERRRKMTPSLKF